MRKQKGLASFADAKVLAMILRVAFLEWCKVWIRFERRTGGKNWTDSEVQQVLGSIIASINGLYGSCGGGATIADALKIRKEALMSPGLERPMELFEDFLDYHGCWLKGELLSRNFCRQFQAWHTPQRARDNGLSGQAAANARSTTNFHLYQELQRDPTVGEFIEMLTLEKTMGYEGIGPASVKAINIYRRDCGYPPLK